MSQNMPYWIKNEDSPANYAKFQDLQIGQAFDFQRDGEPTLPFRRSGSRWFTNKNREGSEIDRMDMLVYIGEH